MEPEATEYPKPTLLAQAKPMANITKASSMSHEDLYNLLVSVLSDLTKLKTAVDTLKTLTDELTDDHATFRTAVADVKTGVNAVITAAATDLAAVAAVTAVASSAPATLTAPKSTAVGTLSTTNND